MLFIMGPQSLRILTDAGRTKLIVTRVAVTLLVCVCVWESIQTKTICVLYRSSGSNYSRSRDSIRCIDWWKSYRTFVSSDEKKTKNGVFINQVGTTLSIYSNTRIINKTDCSIIQQSNPKNRRIVIPFFSLQTYCNNGAPATAFVVIPYNSYLYTFTIEIATIEMYCHYCNVRLYTIWP